ncbi:copper resistance protein CopC, partial [Actinobacteria bacterium OK074]
MDNTGGTGVVRGGVGGLGRRRLARLLALTGALLLLVLFGGVGGASAHAVLENSSPADGSVVKSAPKTVTLTFTESVGLLDDSFRVLDPDNRRVHIGEPGHADGRGDTARVTLPAGMAKGTYLVAWRVVSADSHPVSGAFTFSVGKQTATKAVAPSGTSTDEATATLYDVARYFAYGGLALLLGVLAFSLITGLAVGRGMAATGWWTLFGATVVLLLLRGAYERGDGPGGAFEPAVVWGGLGGRPGIALVVRLVLLGVVAFVPVRLVGGSGGAGERGSVRLRGRRAGVVVGALSLGLALTWAAAEHAAAGIQVPVAMTSAVLHLLAMAVWLGGLTALLGLLYRAPEELPPAAVARFSRAAFASVVVLVCTGVYQAWRGLGSLSALNSTPYGRLLTLKVIAVLLLLAAASYSRRWTGQLVGAGVSTVAAVATAPAAVVGSVVVEERERVPE